MSLRRLALAGFPLAMAFGISILVFARLLAGGPWLPGIPGGWLAGRAACQPMADWSIANRDPYLLVESRAWRLPYSVNVWFLSHRGRLHLLLPNFFGDGLHRRIEDDPHVRVAFGGDIYEQVATRVVEDRDVADLLRPLLRRQFAIEIAGPVRALRQVSGVEMVIYRLDDPLPSEGRDRFISELAYALVAGALSTMSEGGPAIRPISVPDRCDRFRDRVSLEAHP